MWSRRRDNTTGLELSTGCPHPTLPRKRRKEMACNPLEKMPANDGQVVEDADSEGDNGGEIELDA